MHKVEEGEVGLEERKEEQQLLEDKECRTAQVPCDFVDNTGPERQVSVWPMFPDRPGIPRFRSSKVKSSSQEMKIRCFFTNEVSRRFPWGDDLDARPIRRVRSLFDTPSAILELEANYSRSRSR